MQKLPQTYSRYPIFQVRRKLTDEELILAISCIINQVHYSDARDIRRICEKNYGKEALPRRKKLEDIISSLLPHQTASTVSKSSNGYRESHLKIAHFLKENKNISHVDPKKIPFKKTECGKSNNWLRKNRLNNASTAAKRLATPPSSYQSHGDASSPTEILKTSAQPVAQSVDDLQKLQADFPVTSQLGIKRKTPETDDFQDQKAKKIKLQQTKKIVGKKSSLLNDVEYSVCLRGVVQNSECKPLDSATIRIQLYTKKIKEIHTTNLGEFELDIKMKLNKKYCLSASMENHTTEKKDIILRNHEQKEISVNFNLMSQKTNAFQNQKKRTKLQQKKNIVGKKSPKKTASKLPLKDVENAFQNQKKRTKLQQKKKIVGKKNPRKTASKLPLKDVEHTICLRGVVQNSDRKPLDSATIQIQLYTKIIKEIHTSNVGEFELDIEMKLNKKYCLIASKKEYKTEKKDIVLRNLRNKVLSVNFNLVSLKTVRYCKLKFDISIEDLVNLGYPSEVAKKALKESLNHPDLVFDFLP